MSKIVVEVNGKEIVWQSISIRKSLDDICHSLNLTIQETERDFVHKHDRIQVYYKNQHITNSNNQQLVTTVFVDEVTNKVDSKNEVSVMGRSAARDIIDSSWSDSFDGSPDLLTITKAIASKFNISVHHIPTTINETQAVAGFSFTDESPWTRLLNEAENQGYILTSSQAGGLYLTKQPRHAEMWGFELVAGQNLKSVEQTESGGEQFHEYIAKGKATQISVIDYQCKTNRVLTINLTDFEIDEEKLRTRAKTEMLRRRENKIRVSVSGWGLSDKKIINLGSTYQKEIFYEPNFLIPVRIPSKGIYATLLTQSIECTASPSSFETTIELVNKESFYG